LAAKELTFSRFSIQLRKIFCTSQFVPYTALGAKSFLESPDSQYKEHAEKDGDGDSAVTHKIPELQHASILALLVSGCDFQFLLGR
jgi:hypothetical protein